MKQRINIARNNVERFELRRGRNYVNRMTGWTLIVAFIFSIAVWTLGVWIVMTLVDKGVIN